MATVDCSQRCSELATEEARARLPTEEARARLPIEEARARLPTEEARARLPTEEARARLPIEEPDGLPVLAPDSPGSRFTVHLGCPESISEALQIR